MTETPLTAASRSSRPNTSARSALRPVVTLISCFLTVSALMLIALVVLASIGSAVGTAMWIRCSLVLASAVVLLLIGHRAARGSRGAFVRLRIIAPVILAAIVVIVSIPGLLPGWVRVEQAVCGLILLPAVITLWLPRTGSAFRA